LLLTSSACNHLQGHWETLPEERMRGCAPAALTERVQPCVCQQNQKGNEFSIQSIPVILLLLMDSERSRQEPLPQDGGRAVAWLNAAALGKSLTAIPE
jgi:hypothetical protein